MNYTVIDDFLPPDYFENIVNVIGDRNFPWFYIDGIADANDNQDGYLAHSFYQENKVNSGLFDHLKSLIDKINAKSLIRVRALAYIRQDTLTEHGKHVDCSFPHKACVLYLNSNDGFTRLSDGTCIESVKNRALFFDGSLTHNSTNCTTTKRRMVLTINYF